MKIALLIAGTSDPSNSETLADSFVQGVLEQGGQQVTKIRLRELDIEHFSTAAYETDYVPSADFTQVQELIQSCDALIIATPIWNFSVPAHLKNLVDHFGAFALDSETRSKGTLNGLPFYVIFTGGAPYVAWAALMRLTVSHLIEALLYFDATYVGHHYEPKAMKGPGTFGLVMSERPDSLAAMRRKGGHFAKLVRHIKRTGRLPIRNRISRRVRNWGETIIQKVF